MLEAHQNVRDYGGVWYVLNDRFMSVVKESYFITDDGDRKEKPYYSLYNTDDAKYGRHSVTFENDKIDIIADDNKHRFEQPYGSLYIKPIVVGDGGQGRKSDLIIKKRSVGVSTTSIKRAMPLRYKELMTTNIDSDKYLLDSEKSSIPSDKTRQNKRTKRKKKGKKTHRKKK